MKWKLYTWFSAFLSPSIVFLEKYLLWRPQWTACDVCKVRNSCDWCQKVPATVVRGFTNSW